MPSKFSTPVVAAGAGLVITLVGVGWYVADLRRPVDDAALDELESAMLSTSLDLQHQLTTDIDSRQLATEKARAESREGMQLASLCDAWIEFDMNHPSDSTRTNRDRACADYRRFIETGELPQDITQ